MFADDYRGGANLAVGDVTGDGRDELVIGGGVGSNAVRVVRPETGGIAGEFAAGPASGLGVRVGVLPGGSGAIVAAVRDDPAGPVGVFDPAGNRLRSLADPIDEFFPLGVNVGA